MTKGYQRVREHGTIETVCANTADRIGAFRRIVERKQYEKVDGTMIDLFSASLVVQVYDALNQENQARYAAFPAARMAQIAFKLVK